MDGKTVLVLGASRLYAGSIQQIVDLGVRVVAADGNPKAHAASLAHTFCPVDISDPEAVLDVAKREKVDAVVPFSDQGVRAAARASVALGLRGISEHAALLATDKYLMRQAWKEANVPQPKYRLLREADDPEDLSAWPGNGPCIVKPADSRGGGSRGVKVVDKPDQFAEAVAFARSFYADKRVMLEECVRGTEHSMELLGHDGEVHVLCVGDKIKTPYPYRVDAAVVYPTKLSGERLEQAVQAAKSGALALGLETFAAHVELAMTKEGPRLFELGARFGGGHTASHILPHVTGRKFLQDYVRLLLGQKSDIATARFSKGCVYRFIMPKPGVVADVTGLEEVSRMEGVLDAAVFFGPGTTIPRVKTGLDRAGFIVTGMNSREEALELSLKAEAMIQFHYL